VLPRAVIDREVSGKPEIPLNRVLEGHGVSPLLAEGLDKPFGFAVGSWCVRPGSNVLESKNLAGLGKST
jgi:hypothetical protein